jgi:hypothetical protein
MPSLSVRLLAFLAAAAIAVGTWLAWIDHVSAANLPMRRLIGESMHKQTESFPSSIGALLILAAVIGLVGVAMPSPTAAFVGALFALVVTGLLLVQEYRELPHHLADVVGSGVWCVGVGGVVLLLVSFGLAKSPSSH